MTDEDRADRLDELFLLARSGEPDAFAEWMGMVEIPLRRRLRRFARAVDVEAHVVVAAQDCLACVHPHPHANLGPGWPRLGREQSLRCILIAGQGATGDILDPAAISRQENHVAISQPVGQNHLSLRVHGHRFAAGKLLRAAA